MVIPTLTTQPTKTNKAMKTNIILAAWAIAATAAAITNCSDLTSEIAVPEDKTVDVIAMPIDGKLSYSVAFTSSDLEPLDLDITQYDGLTISSHRNIRSFTESICTECPDLNHYGMVVDIPEKNISVELPIIVELHELLKAAFADGMNITFTLEYSELWEAYSWNREAEVTPDYPDTFYAWNL